MKEVYIVEARSRVSINSAIEDHCEHLKIFSTREKAIDFMNGFNEIEQLEYKPHSLCVMRWKVDSEEDWSLDARIVERRMIEDKAND